MGGGGGSTQGDTVVTTRFAPYIEEKHSSALNVSIATRKAVINDSPYADYPELSADDAFLSAGYMLSSYPALCDVFGKNLAGLDIDSLFTEAFQEKMADTSEYVETELSIIDDSIEQMQAEKIKARDLNAAGSSTFIMSQANIETDKIMKTAKLRQDVVYGLIPGIAAIWTKMLNWEKEVVVEYAQALKNFYLCKISSVEFAYQGKSNDALWPEIVLDFERTMIACAMAGSRSSRTMTERERSDLSKALLVGSYTWQGAQLGSYWGPYGTAAGAVVGFVIGMAMMLME